MAKAKSTIAVFAALIALGATLDAMTRAQGDGMGGRQGSGQHSGEGMDQQQNAQGSGDMTRERTRTRDMPQSGIPDMQHDMEQHPPMRQEDRQTQQTVLTDAGAQCNKLWQPTVADGYACPPRNRRWS